MQDPELERITIDLRRQRELIERDMNDTDRNINAAELLERIDLLRKRIEESQSSFGNVIPSPPAVPKPTI